MEFPTAPESHSPEVREVSAVANSGEGFTLVETLMAILILAAGLLAAGQLIYITMGSASLSRSKSVAALEAQNQLELLADLYRQNPAAADLADGSHGPRQVQILNPNDGTVLNRFNVSWTVSAVSDPRPGKIIPARQITVAVTPIDGLANVNNKTPLNKVVSVAAVFSAAAQ